MGRKGPYSQALWSRARGAVLPAATQLPHLLTTNDSGKSSGTNSFYY